MKNKKIDWIAFAIVTFTILCVLKLTGFISISWWWVTAPIILIGFIIFIILMTALVIYLENRR